MLGIISNKKFGLKRYIEMKRLSKDAEEYSKNPNKKSTKKSYIEEQKKY